VLYFVTPAWNVFPGISRLFDETVRILGDDVPAQHIYLDTINRCTADDIVVFGAWHQAYAVPIRRCKASMKIIEFSSPLLQQELTQVEATYFTTILSMLDRNYIQGIWLVDRDNYETFSKVNDNIFYTPHPFDPAPYKMYQHESTEKSDVAFFTVFTNRQKNVLTQLAAARCAQNDLEFKLYVNGLPEQYRQFADMIGLKYNDLGWLPHDDYHAWLGSMRLLIQVSLSEAFSYVAAESMALGTPVLMSPVVARTMGVALKIFDCSCVSEIANAISCLLQLPAEQYQEYSEMYQRTIADRAEQSNKEVRNVFTDLAAP